MLNQEDDLLDDLMNIVQSDEKQPTVQQLKCPFSKKEGDGGGNKMAGEANECGELEMDDDFGEDQQQNRQYSDIEDDDDSVDEMLEKPIDILDDKKADQINFYTYDKVQIKSNKRIK